MTAKLKHYLGRKRIIYKRLRAGEKVLRPQYHELVITVRRLTRKAKGNYELYDGPQEILSGIQDEE